MNIHKNARLTVWGREQAVRQVTHAGYSARRVARSLRTTERTCGVGAPRPRRRGAHRSQLASPFIGKVLPDERGDTAAGFLRRTVSGLRRLGVRVAAVMTDNGSFYRSRRCRATGRALGIRQLFTRPYTPRTNGKVERFIKKDRAARVGLRGCTTIPTSAAAKSSAPW